MHCMGQNQNSQFVSVFWTAHSMGAEDQATKRTDPKEILATVAKASHFDPILILLIDQDMIAVSQSANG